MLEEDRRKPRLYRDICDVDRAAFQSGLPYRSLGPKSEFGTPAKLGEPPCSAAPTSPSPSYCHSVAKLPSHSRVALVRIVSNTGVRSVGELEITRRTSDITVCCSSASLSSRVRACTSSNSRTFSI